MTAGDTRAVSTVQGPKHNSHVTTKCGCFRSLAVCVATVSAIFFSQPAQAITIRVPQDYRTIQEAINWAANGDEIVVSPAVYVENINFKGKNIVLRSSNPTDTAIVAATIVDGNKQDGVVRFAGSETSGCVLSGFTIRNGTRGVYGNGTNARIEYNVITGNSVGGGGGLYGCNGTIQNNVITGNVANYGGGLYGCNGTIQNNTITGNSAKDFGSGGGYGGGLCLCYGIVQSNVISGNSARWQGGGVCSCNGIIQNNVISGNSARFGGGLYDCDGTIQNSVIAGNSAWFGGGLYECDCTIQNNEITSNSASGGGLSDYGYGGGLYRCNGTIQNNVISSNSASGGGLSGYGEGGGLYRCNGTIQNNVISGNSATFGGGLYECECTIQNNTITGNSANYSGGGSDYGDGGGLYRCGTIQNNVISSNTALRCGGGLHSCLHIRCNLIRGNSAGAGAGIDSCNGVILGNMITNNVARLSGGGISYCRGGATIQNNIIAYNRAETGDGGGLNLCEGKIANNTIAWNSASRGGGLCDCQGTIFNCIIWGNSAPTGPQTYLSYPSYSCIQDHTLGGTGIINQDPRFTGPNDFHLKRTSPCIDTGTNENCPTTDKDGNRRPYDAHGSGRAVCDMGAYEYVGPPQSSLPDLIVAGPSVAQSLTGRVGQMVDVPLGVGNVGPAGCVATWAHIYLSRDSIYDAGDYLWIPGNRVPALGPGQTLSGVLSGARIPNLPSAIYHVIAYCDIINEVDEWDEDNNWKEIGTLSITTTANKWEMYR